MAGRNRWRPARAVIDLPGGGSREQTPEEAMADARALVQHLMTLGFAQSTVAKLMRPPMDPATLRKHFRDDLALGKQRQMVRVAATAFQLAVSGRNPAMTRFWLRTRAGWSVNSDAGEPREIVVQSIPGDDGL